MSHALRSVLVAALSAACLIPIAGCSAASEPTEPVVIGYLGGLSGRSSGLGLAARDGAQLAVETANASRPEGKPPVVLEVADDGAGGEAAVAGVQALAKAGAVAIVGPLTSVSAVAAAPVAEQVGVPLLSPTVSSTDFSGKDDMFLRTCADNQLYASILASQVVEKHGPVVTTAIYDIGNRSYTERLYTHFKDTIEKLGGKVVDTQTFTSGDNPDYTALAARALKDDPGCVLLVANSIDSALLCQRLRRAGYDGPIALSHWSATDDLLTNGGKAVEGTLLLDNYDRGSTYPDYTRMFNAFKARYGYEPNFSAIHAYDATLLALRAADNRRPNESMKDALLRQGPYEGVQGAIKLDENGDTVRQFYLMTIVNSSFEATTTP